MSIVALFAADTHISRNTWASRSNIVGDSFFAFKQICDKAIVYQCPIFLAGDCWELWRESRPDAETVRFVRYHLSRLQKANIPFYYINGQHDGLSQPYWFNAVHEWPIHIGNELIEHRGFKVFGVDYFEPTQIELVKNSIPEETDILLMHQSWGQFVGSTNYSTLSLDALPPVPVVISGDTHVSAIIKDGNQIRISPGATHMRSIKEPRKHSFITLNSSVVFNQVELMSRSVIDFVVSDKVNWVNDIDKLKVECDSIYRNCLGLGYSIDVAKPLVIVYDSVDSDAESILSEEIDACHFIYRVGKSDKSVIDVVDNVVDTSDLDGVISDCISELDLSDEQKSLLKVITEGRDLLKYFNV